MVNMILKRILLYAFVVASGLGMARSADLRYGVLHGDPLVIMAILMAAWIVVCDVRTLISISRSHQEQMIRKLADLTEDPDTDVDDQ